jgi:cbb3-type cytochrome oxidase maturation protein
METIYLLIPIALVFVLISAVVLVWAIGSGQYDDLERAAQDILLEEELHGASVESRAPVGVQPRQVDAILPGTSDGTPRDTSSDRT